jgi:cytochrome c oxidase subunit 2
VKKFWAIFFWFWPVAALVLCVMAPSQGWWFPGPPGTQMGERIQGLFELILGIVTVTFIGTNFALGLVLWRSASKGDDHKAYYSHGSHSLELIWTIVPAFVLLFIALYQMDVWAEFRVQSFYPEETKQGSVAEFMARQFEWRIRYPAIGETLKDEAQPGDLYMVNELHVPAGKPVKINLRTQDVQHAFFAPQLRLKQDAVPGLIIPVWFNVPKAGNYDVTCAELCGWGHYKMKARIVVESQQAVDAYMKKLQEEQTEDGFVEEASEEE